ncbi:MAG TPA: transposase, partial [Acidimicrobiales bacterium]|nr:transposase [Acidimicrobiales bacterium]
AGAGGPVRSPSARREKARRHLARCHREAARRRAAHLHALTKTLAVTGAVVVLEDLNVKGMTARGGSHKKGLNRRITEAGFGEIRRQLTYKAGPERIVIGDRFYPSSKTCSACQKVNDGLTLADRTWTCKNCRTTHDRDHNAAVNLAAWGEAREGKTRAGDPDTPGPVSREISARPQRGAPRRPGNRPTPERPDRRADTAGTRQHPDRGASDLDGPGQGPVATTTRDPRKATVDVCSSHHSAMMSACAGI